MVTNEHNPKSGRRRADCSFCGSPQSQVFRLIAGPGVYICDQCVYLCLEIVEQMPRSEYLASLKAQVQLLRKRTKPVRREYSKAHAAEAQVEQLLRQISVLEASAVPPDVLRAELNRVEGKRERESNVLFENLARAIESHHPGMPKLRYLPAQLVTAHDTSTR
jgi:hypothetical protein